MEKNTITARVVGEDFFGKEKVYVGIYTGEEVDEVAVLNKINKTFDTFCEFNCDPAYSYFPDDNIFFVTGEVWVKVLKPVFDKAIRYDIAKRKEVE